MGSRVDISRSLVIAGLLASLLCAGMPSRASILPSASVSLPTLAASHHAATSRSANSPADCLSQTAVVDDADDFSEPLGLFAQSTNVSVGSCPDRLANGPASVPPLSASLLMQETRRNC